MSDPTDDMAVVVVRRGQQRAAAAPIAAGHADYPSFRFVFPDPRRRAKVLPVFFEATVRDAIATLSSAPPPSVCEGLTSSVNSNPSGYSKVNGKVSRSKVAGSESSSSPPHPAIPTGVMLAATATTRRTHVRRT
jgi:hypothetical protein